MKFFPKQRCSLQPERFPFFYGWVVAVVGTLGIVMSIPGQTIGVSVFTDSLIGVTGLSRLQLSNAYLMGTVASGLLLPRGGRLIDRFGVRAVALGASLWLAGTLLYFTQVGVFSDFAKSTVGSSFLFPFLILLMGFVSLRFSGQGMLTMASRAMLGKWFNKYRGRVSGFSGLFVSFGFSSAPLFLGWFVDQWGWQGAWGMLALIVGVGMGSVVWFFFKEKPEDFGLQMDGMSSEQNKSATDVAEINFTREQAIRTTAFWSVTLALSFQALSITGISFHIVDLAATAGLDKSQALLFFLPMSVVSTAFGFLMGWVAEKTRVQHLVLAMMVFSLLGVWSLTRLGENLFYWTAILGMGASGGFYSVLLTLALPKLFGRLHLGAISGFQMMSLVIASAIGPSLFASSKALFGSYNEGIYFCSVIPVCVFLFTAILEFVDLRHTSSKTRSK